MKSRQPSRGKWRSRCSGRAAVLVALAVTPLLLLAAWWAMGGVINVTTSLPYGLYQKASTPLQRGSLVVFCPPLNDVSATAHVRGYLRAGRCPGGWTSLLKPVAALQGDHVRFSDEAVYVNGIPLPNSARVARDPMGRALPRPPMNEHRLAANELLLISSYTASSYDGRYLGVVSTDGLQGTVSPLLTWRSAPRPKAIGVPRVFP